MSKYFNSFLLIFAIIVASPYALAADFSITSVEQQTFNPYKGDFVKFKASVQADSSNICGIECEFSVGTDSGSVSDSGKPPATRLTARESQEFPFSVRAEGSPGTILSNLVVTCKRPWSLPACVETTLPSKTKSVSFTFLYAGDGVCTTSREKCNAYNQYVSAPSDCICSKDKECRPNSNRETDEQGCATFCGNGVVEKQYEACDDCPSDVGKCDGTSCVQGNECEGKYCVHNVCDNLPYRIGDSYCDKNVGETCRNSGSDCACGANQRCSNSGVCETFCGNGVCEASEQGICETDCKWCGDGTCESSESCSSCDVDCGACKKPTKEEELQRNTQDKSKRTNSASDLQTRTTSAKKEQMTVSLFGKEYTSTTIIIGAIALIMLLAAVGFLIYDKFKFNSKEDKKDQKHHAERKESSGHKESRCKKCNKKIDEDAKFCHHCGNKLN